MPIITDRQLTEEQRKLWLKAVQAVEIRNFGFAIMLIQNLVKDQPGFLDGRKLLRKAAVAHTKGKKAFLSGLSTASMKGGSALKKDPLEAMVLAEKQLESDPYNAQANQLLKDAAKQAGFIETAIFALETIVEGNPKDQKALHELGDFMISIGQPDKAVDVFQKIVDQNPADLIAVKKVKDCSASATMKKGGWEQATSYKDLIRDKDLQKSLEEKSRLVRTLEQVETQLSELSPVWENDQTHVDNTRRLAKLWEERLEYKQDRESTEGALYFYRLVDQLAAGGDPAVQRKVSDLEVKLDDIAIKEIEDWLAAGGAESEEGPAYQAELERLKSKKSEAGLTEAKKRVERNPTDLQLRFELGEKLLEQGNFSDAIPELQMARQNPATRLKSMAMLGRCFVLKGMLDMASSQFKAAASEMPAMDATKKDTLYDLALVYEKMGKTADYIEALKQIIEVDYRYKDAAARVEGSYGG